MSAAFDPEAVIDALAPLLGLTVPAEARAAVATNLRIAAAMAELVLERPLGDHAEPAPVFTPVDRGDAPVTGLHARTAAAIAADVASGAVSAEAVARAALDRIAALDGRVGAFTAVTADRALAKARSIDADRAAGRPLGPLAGVPYGVKNLFDLAGLTTLAGSRIARDDPPAARDAVLVERMEAAGAVCLGALNMGEYAYDFTGENLHHGPSRNPHDLGRMSGGSSGGSGACVAAGFAPLALCSDTNGSIRVPAALCGLFGLKPTYGRLGRSRTFPFVASLDHLGPVARSAEDLALCYDALQGPDPEDAAWAGRPVEATLPTLGAGAYRACASPRSAAISPSGASPPPRPPWRAARRRSARPGPPSCRTLTAPAPPPS